MKMREDPMVFITHDPIDYTALRQQVQRPGAGAILIFEGTTRDNFEEKSVSELRYEAYEAMAVSEMEALRNRIQADHPETRVAMAHRLGVVGVCETSVVTVVSAPHRDEAYVVSRRVIDDLKQLIPIWKKEIYEDGSAWKANAGQ
ncbi:MAG: molybdenum cofactor biosynthesis protein MoaE [Myxococcota bacterium]|nr:molybdenum cofactor biosynthesis protein MoaE [Myxococcota bacterium]MEC8379576.1 molybdenum cofactor biosynthesis protein MoaE [Myxococcota bacterium]